MSLIDFNPLNYEEVAAARAVLGLPPPLGRCAFCEATEGLYLCAWPVWGFEATAYGALRIGDQVRRITDKRQRRPATVVHLVKQDVRDYPDPRVFVTISIGSRLKEFAVYQRSPVQVLKDRNCDTPCCELHRCERGPGATFCASHWALLEYYPPEKECVSN